MTAKPRHLIALSFISNLKGNHDLTRSLLEISADGLLQAAGKNSAGMASFKLQMLPALQAAWSL